MLELIAIVALSVLGLVLAVCGLLLLPLILVGFLLKLLLFVILLPFKILGFLVGLVGSLFAGIGKALLVVGGFVVVLALLVGGVVLLPLIPLLAIAAFIWVIVRLAGTATVAAG